MPEYNSWSQIWKLQSMLQRAMPKMACACGRSCSEYNASRLACSAYM